MLTEEFIDALHEWPGALLPHVEEAVEVEEALVEQRVRAGLHRVRLHLHVEAERLPRRAEQGEQRRRDGADEEDAVSRSGDEILVSVSPMPKRRFLKSRKVSSIVKRRP